MKDIKSVAIIVAMKKELNLLLPLINEKEEVVVDGVTIYSGTIKNLKVIVMQCGIGKVNSALGTLILLNNFSVDLVINTGVAGGADNSVSVMDTVIGSRIAYHDVWCGPGTIYGQASGFPKYFQSDDEIVSLIDFESDSSKKSGLICSGDKFIMDVNEVAYIKNNYRDALAVDMESASIAQVCYLRKVPFLCIRVISDSPGANHNNVQQYDDFWEDAPLHTFKIVEEVFEKL